MNEPSEEDLELHKRIDSSPHLLPITVIPHPRSNLKKIDKSKFLVSGDLKLMDVKAVIRSKLSLNKTESLFLYVGHSKRLCNDSNFISLTSDSILRELRFLTDKEEVNEKEMLKNSNKENKYEFLEIYYSNMETFGSQRSGVSSEKMDYTTHSS